MDANARVKRKLLLARFARVEYTTASVCQAALFADRPRPVSMSRTHLRQRQLRRWCVGIMLVAYLFTVTGFPAHGSSKKSGHQPFPCQDHDCGCASAEECWTNCCCFSPEQHLAWAHEHGIEPPAYAVLSSGPGRDVTHGDHDCAHCSNHKEHKDHEDSDCLGSLAHAQEASTCCQKIPAGANSSQAQNTDDRIRWVITIKGMACRGLSTLWVASGSVAPPPRSLSWDPLYDVDEHLPVTDANPVVQLTAPLDPPPRLVNPR
jgi:hypothetical protein